MKEKLINDIARKMLPYLDNAQLAKLEEVLEHSFYGFEILLSDEKMDNKADTINNSNMLYDNRINDKVLAYRNSLGNIYNIKENNKNEEM